MAQISNATFDVVLFSCDLGMAKPDPAIYLTATDQLGTNPADASTPTTNWPEQPRPGLTTLRITELINTNPNW